jgi:acyl-CoA thioester hydrolase
MARATPPHRNSYTYFHDIQTRWMDNDVYGHVNNVVYYSYFDTIVNQWLVTQGLLDIHHGKTIGLVVETSCAYFSPLAFPDAVEGGLKVSKIGTSSVCFEVGLFLKNTQIAAASGRFVHVYVDRTSRKPLALDESWRIALARLQTVI